MRAHTQRILGAGRDYRQMLGVSSEAPRAEARRAYLTIQKYLNENGIKYSNLVNHREVTSSELAEAKEACQKLGDAKVMILEPDSTPARDLRRRDEKARQEQAAREEQERRERAEREREERRRERRAQEQEQQRAHERRRRQQQSGWQQQQQTADVSTRDRPTDVAASTAAHRTERSG